MSKKKVSKVLLAALMVAAVGAMSAMPAFAANTVYNAGDNWVGSDYVDATHTGTAITTKQTITVTNVRDQKSGVANTNTEVDVIAYQLVKGQYKDGKLTNYILCDATNAAIADMEAPTVSEITTIANNVRAGATTLNGIHLTQGTGAQTTQYTAQVEAGLYIVLASGANGYVYNPAIVAVNVTDANDVAGTAEGTTVDLATYWRFPANAYLKSSTTSFNKDVLGSEASPFVKAEDTEGDITSKGAIVSFKLDGMVVPTYTDEYAKPGQNEAGVIYKINDKLDGVAFAGITDLTVKTNTGATMDKLDEHGDPVVNDNGTPNDDSDDYVEQVLVETTVTPNTMVDDDNDPITPDIPVPNYTVVYKNAAGTVVTGDDIATSAVSYELQFSDAWLRANAEKNVTVDYKARFTDEAAVNGTANKTVASLTYTVDPSNNTGVEVLRDSTYHYTFEIGGQIDGSANGTTTGTVDGTKSFHDYSINKVTEALVQGGAYEADDTTGEFSSEHALAGATFTLYDDAAFTTIHQNKVRNAATGVWETVDATYTTQDDGRLVFTGLDVGTYYLKETVAPDGYTLNDNDYKVVIAGTIADGSGAAEQGTLTGYSITVSVKNGAGWDECGSAVYAFTPAVTKPTTDANAMNFDVVVNTATTTVAPAEVVDTQLAALPATGGAGTIAITIGAAVGMGIFLTIFIVNKRKNKSEE